MNRLSEQLTAEYNIIEDKDQPLRGKALLHSVVSALGNNCRFLTLGGKKYILFEDGEKRTVIFVKAITYLGEPHPVYKKRIQIPQEWVAEAQDLQTKGYEVKFMGVYHYDGFILFADFNIDGYLKRNCHNSSAHVYINDLYQGALNGVFEKIDNRGNKIATISRQHLSDYLQGNFKPNKLLELFGEFNSEFPFGVWLKATECVREMHKREWSQWRQAEWQGWFLEYKFSHFADKETVSPYMCYTALSNKGHKEESFDFDIYFPIEQFMGDLKSSDITKTESPGNDQSTFIDCINKYGKFWYVIYEHDTIYDKNCQFEATKWRNNYLKKVDNIPDAKFKELSYKDRMKNSVRFQRMFIIELNRINFHKALSDFNQGKQADGSSRKKKFLIKKNEIDNFIIYRYNGVEETE